MNHSEFIKALSEKSKYMQSDLEIIFKNFEELIVDKIRKGESIKLFTGFTLESVQSNSKKHYNLQTKKWEQTPPSIQCKLRTTKKFKERLNA